MKSHKNSKARTTVNDRLARLERTCGGFWPMERNHIRREMQAHAREAVDRFRRKHGM